MVEGDDDVLNIDRRSMVKYLLAALALVAVAVIAIVGYRTLSTPSHTVPNLIGSTEAQVMNLVATNGWKLDVRRVHDDTQVPGNVIRTDPAAGDHLEQGSTLVLVVSDGPTLSKLPEIAGMSVEDARTLLTSVGLSMREASSVNTDSVPVGSVVSWSVPGQLTLAAGGQVVKGTTIEVVVASGPSTVVVPNLLQLTVDDARAELESAGLALGTVTEQFSAMVPAGALMSADPQAGAPLTVGGAVNVVVSKGQDLVVMPDVVGKTLQQATDAMTKAGLQVGSVTGPTAGTVSWCGVTPGTKILRGTAVAMTLASPATVSGPSGP